MRRFVAFVVLMLAGIGAWRDGSVRAGRSQES